IELDLTYSSPAPQSNQQPDPEPVADKERKPSSAKLGFRVYIPNPLTNAEKRNGTPQTYSDHLGKPAFDIKVQIHGVDLKNLKISLFKCCNSYKAGCGSLLEVADRHDQVALRCYVTHGGPFGKSLMPLLSMELTYTAFKEMHLKKEGKEIGFSLVMENPRVAARNNSREMKFDHALAHGHPAKVEPGRMAELEMDVSGFCLDLII
ncbi:hypothetical protein DFH28DRAFT_901221, partial [Melampsora americana]